MSDRIGTKPVLFVVRQKLFCPNIRRFFKQCKYGIIRMPSYYMSIEWYRYQGDIE